MAAPRGIPAGRANPDHGAERGAVDHRSVALELLAIGIDRAVLFQARCFDFQAASQADSWRLDAIASYLNTMSHARQRRVSASPPRRADRTPRPNPPSTRSARAFRT